MQFNLLKNFIFFQDSPEAKLNCFWANPKGFLSDYSSKKSIHPASIWIYHLKRICSLFPDIFIILSFSSFKKLFSADALTLTPNMWAIRPSLARSKWNMDKICGLKFHFSYVDMPQDFFGNSSIRTPSHFYYWICTFDQNSSFIWGKFIN